MLALEVPEPSDAEVKSCLEEGRHEARRQVNWSDPVVEVMKKKFYG